MQIPWRYRFLQSLINFRDWFIAQLVFLSLKLLRLIPMDSAIRIFERFARWLGPKLKRHQVALDNLELAFPEKSTDELAAIGSAVWGNMGAIFAEYAQLEDICRDRLDVVIHPAIRTFQDPAHHQAVFVSAHFGNWELLAAAISRSQVPVTAVFTPLQNPLLDARLARQRRHLGCHLLPRDESMRPLIRELAQGRSIGLVMDQRVDSGHPVPMFGIDKQTTLIPARLALRHDAELVACRCDRQPDGRFRIEFFPPIVADDESASEVDQAIQMSRQVNALFEQWITDRPADWFCTNRRWPKSAVAAPSASAHKATDSHGGVTYPKA